MGTSYSLDNFFNIRAFSSNLLCAIITAITCPFSKYFQFLGIFAQVFKYFTFFDLFNIFCPVLPFFWKIACMPLLFRIGPGYASKLKKKFLSSQYKEQSIREIEKRMLQWFFFRKNQNKKRVFHQVNIFLTKTNLYM